MSLRHHEPDSRDLQAMFARLTRDRPVRRVPRRCDGVWPRRKSGEPLCKMDLHGTRDECLVVPLPHDNHFAEEDTVPIRLSPHPLYVWCGDKWLGRRTKRGWMFCSGKTFRFRGRFLSSSDFSRMTRPVPPTWRRRGGVTGSSAPIARRRQSRSASPAGPASCAAGSAAATPG